MVKTIISAHLSCSQWGLSLYSDVRFSLQNQEYYMHLLTQNYGVHAVKYLVAHSQVPGVCMIVTWWSLKFKGHLSDPLLPQNMWPKALQSFMRDII